MAHGIEQPDHGHSAAAVVEGAGKRLVYDGPHLQALVRRGSSPFVLITFNSRGSVANGESIWGDPLLKKLHLNAVGFVTKQPNWFPGEDLTAAINAVLPFIAPFQERIGYGYSQGAYAAIRASVPLGLTATVALSPQWSIDPDDIVDTRYNRYFDKDVNRGMALTAEDAPARLTVIVDTSFEEDVRHLSRITGAIGSAEIVNLPSSEHETVRVLRGTDTFAALIDAVRTGKSLSGAIAPARRASPIRREVMVKRSLRRRQGERAARLFAGLSLEGKSKTRMLVHFARNGAGAWVLDAAQQHVREEPRNALARAAFACVLASAGRKGRAQRVAAKAEEMSRGARILALTKAARTGVWDAEHDEDE